MFNLLDLQQQRAHKALTAKELVDKAEKAEGGARPMTADEIQIFDRLKDEIGKLDGAISAVEAHQRRAEESRKLIEDLEKPVPRGAVPVPPGSPTTTAAPSDDKIYAKYHRFGPLKAFKNTEEDRRKAIRAGLWIRAMFYNDQRAAQFCMNNGMAVNIRDALSTNSNTDGGVLVPDELSQAIIDLRETYGVFRQNARIWEMGSDTLLVPRRLGGVTIGPVGENPASAISQTNPTFNNVQLVAKKCGGLCLMSSEIAEDAIINLADWVANEFAYGFAKFEDDCAFIGDGTSTYLGIRGLGNILTEASGLAGAVTVATATHDLASEIDASDIAGLMAKLPQYAQPNAKFYCSALMAEMVFGRLMAVAGGNNVMTLQENTGVRTRGNYLGYPIVIAQSCPAVLTTLDALPMFYFGDLSKSSHLGDRRMVKIFASADRYMDTDQIAIRGLERIDIVHADVGTSTVPGPILALTGSTS